MISEFTPPGIKVVAIRTGGNIVTGRLYTTRGMVLNRHWRTREPDAHVLLVETRQPPGRFGEVGYPREGFELAALPLQQIGRELEAVE